MTSLTRKRIILIALGVLVLAAVIYGFLPDPHPVQTATVQRGPLRVIIEEEGQTQVEERYEISSPVAAFARRIDLEVGDLVQAGQPIVQLEPPRSAILDPRTRAEAAARSDAARAALAQASEQAQAADAVADLATLEFSRIEQLQADGSATRQTLEQAAAEAEQAEANRLAARATVAAAQADLAAARSALQGGASGGSGMSVQDVLRAPAAGRVLAVHRRSEGHVNPGETLVEVGDTERLDVRIDVLSQEAVRIHPGTRVILDLWGGDVLLEAEVDRIEPDAFTDVSSLGVKERRVTVVANLVSSPQAWSNLGAGYRVLARFIVWEETNVLQIPTGAVFQTDEGQAVFVVENGRAIRRSVTLGQQGGLTVQILSGVTEGDVVIVHIDSEIEDGMRVEAR